MISLNTIGVLRIDKKIKMKVVITGGNGYIGARLSIFLAKKGFEIIPICFPAIPNDEEWKREMSAIYEGDVRTDETIALIANLKADAIIHLVSLDHFESEKEPGFVNEINVLPTWRLLDACTKQGLKKFIYFSTVHVYGKLDNSIIYEDYKVKTPNAYALTHYLCENICDYYNRKTNTNVIVARLSNSYGGPLFLDNNCWWLAINDLCKNAFLKKEIRLLSDGSPQRDFIHGNDVCKAIFRLIDSDKKNLDNNIFHISSGETMTLLELAIIIRDVFQIRFGQLLPIITPDKVISDSDQPINVRRYQINNEKIKGIGFDPDYNIISGVNELFNYLEDNYDRIEK